MIKTKQIISETGSTTIQSAYILIFSVILFTIIISLGNFYYQKHSIQSNIQIMNLKIANMTINENKKCSKAVTEILKQYNENNKTKIQINKYKCTNEWIQIQGKSQINIFQIPITISGISRAGIKK